MKQLFPLFLLAILLTSCQNAELSALQTKNAELLELNSILETSLAEAQKPKTGFVHAVYFWFVEDMTEEQKMDFIKGCDLLAQCPTVNHIQLGTPAGTPREIVDNTYDFAAIVEFVDKEAHDAYQIDPSHDKFREEYGKYFARVQIYDTLIK